MTLTNEEFVENYFQSEQGKALLNLSLRFLDKVKDTYKLETKDQKILQKNVGMFMLEFEIGSKMEKMYFNVYYKRNKMIYLCYDETEKKFVYGNDDIQMENENGESINMSSEDFEPFELVRNKIVEVLMYCFDEEKDNQLNMTISKKEEWLLSKNIHLTNEDKNYEFLEKHMNVLYRNEGSTNLKIINELETLLEELEKTLQDNLKGKGLFSLKEKVLSLINTEFYYLLKNYLSMPLEMQEKQKEIAFNTLKDIKEEIEDIFEHQLVQNFQDSVTVFKEKYQKKEL